MMLQELLQYLLETKEHDSYWDDQRIYAVKELAAKGADNDWLALATHRNGFIRETAVAMLQQTLTRESVRTVLSALNDWVPNVREKAKQVLDFYLMEDCAAALLANTDMLVALQRRSRENHQATIKKVQNYLQNPALSSVVVNRFFEEKGRIALFLFEILLIANPLLAANAAIDHSDNFVRYVVVRRHRSFSAEVAEQLLSRAINDPSGRVKVAALRIWLPKEADQNIRQQAVEQALLHSSGAVRLWAIWAAKEQGVDPSQVLKQACKVLPQTKRGWLGLLGLILDSRAEQALPIVVVATTAPLVNVRYKALIVYSALAQNNAYQVLVNALQDKEAKIAHYAAKELNKQLLPEGIALLVEMIEKLVLDQYEERLNWVLPILPLWQHLQVLLELANVLSNKTLDCLLKQWQNRHYMTSYLPKIAQEQKNFIAALLPQLGLPKKKKEQLLNCLEL